MVGLTYLVANYIYNNRNPNGIDKKQIIEYMKTTNVSFLNGAELSLDLILNDLEMDNLVCVHNDKIFVRIQEEKWKQYTEEEDMSMEESDITTVHEAIYDYTLAEYEYREKIDKIKKQHQNEIVVLKAIIGANFNLTEDTPIMVGGETISILFRNKIEYKIFEALENTGLEYEVISLDNRITLRIFVDPYK
ncbi:MAG: hypothetical protein BZ138_07315 [Methanosphaera sp. rholeuAM270]|nr:MAG: hypothetical protein BZ138_07315 [Methanosphaera sp. rholeuAM270]